MYAGIDDFEDRFPVGPPSLRRCNILKCEETSGSGRAVMEGNVELPTPMTVPGAARCCAKETACMRVLVTGSGGYIGGVLVRRLLADGHDVVALIHQTALDVRHDKLQVAHANVLDRDALAEFVGPVEVICHLAGRRGVRQSRLDPHFEVNVGGSVNLLDAVAGPSCRVVFASTASVYGEPIEQPISEDHPPLPVSAYGASKLAVEHLLRFESATGRIGAIALRLFNVTGAHHVDGSRLVPRAVAAVAGGTEALRVDGDGSVVRDYVHVDDAVEAFLLALGACQPGNYEVYNVGGVASVTEVLEMVARVSGRPVPVRHAPPAVEPPVLIADTRRIRENLGWTPRRSTLAAIVQDAWACR